MAYTPMVLNCQPIIPFFSRPSFTILPRSSTVGFFNGRQSETHRSGPIDVCRYTGRGNKQCILPFQSENCSIHLFPGTEGEHTCTGCLPTKPKRRLHTYMSIYNRSVVIIFHITFPVQNSSYRLAALFSCPLDSLFPQHITLLVRQGIRNRWSRGTNIC